MADPKTEAEKKADADARKAAREALAAKPEFAQFEELLDFALDRRTERETAARKAAEKDKPKEKGLFDGLLSGLFDTKKGGE